MPTLSLCVYTFFVLETVLFAQHLHSTQYTRVLPWAPVHCWETCVWLPGEQRREERLGCHWLGEALLWPEVVWGAWPAVATKPAKPYQLPGVVHSWHATALVETLPLEWVKITRPENYSISLGEGHPDEMGLEKWKYTQVEKIHHHLEWAVSTKMHLPVSNEELQYVSDRNGRGLGLKCISSYVLVLPHTVSAYPQAAAQLNRWDIFSFHRQGGAFNQQQPHTESLESVCIWICVGRCWHWASLTPWPFWYNELHINVAPFVASLNQNFIILVDSVLLCSLCGCVAFWFCLFFFPVVHLTDVL